MHVSPEGCKHLSHNSQFPEYLAISISYRIQLDRLETRFASVYVFSNVTYTTLAVMLPLIKLPPNDTKETQFLGARSPSTKGTLKRSSKISVTGFFSLRFHNGATKNQDRCSYVYSPYYHWRLFSDFSNHPRLLFRLLGVVLYVHYPHKYKVSVTCARMYLVKPKQPPCFYIISSLSLDLRVNGCGMMALPEDQMLTIQVFRTKWFIRSHTAKSC